MTEKNKIDETVAAVENELQQAVEKAKQFHPVTKLYVDGYTGEINRYKTPDNYVPDEGVSCGSPDLCHTEDYVTIAQMYERLKNMKALSIQDSDFDFVDDEVSVDDLDEDTISDVVSVVDDPADYDDYVMPFINEKLGSDSGAKASDSGAAKEATGSVSKEEATQEPMTSE